MHIHRILFRDPSPAMRALQRVDSDWHESYDAAASTGGALIDECAEYADEETMRTHHADAYAAHGYERPALRAWPKSPR